MEQQPLILDPCCGSRMMWFDRVHKDVVFGDRRSEMLTVTDRSHKKDGTRTLVVEPDALMDFRALEDLVKDAIELRREPDQLKQAICEFEKAVNLLRGALAHNAALTRRP